MEDVEVIGKGPRAQRLLDEMEAGARGLTLLSSDGGGEVRHVYRVEAASPGEAEAHIVSMLGSASTEFRVLAIT
jgi:hypothetical protein